MPLLLHTADIHLRRDRAERLEALKQIVKRARGRGAHLIIAGDLYDGVPTPATREAAEELLKEVSPGHVFVSPGCRDADAFPPDSPPPENVHVLREPGEVVEVEGLRVSGAAFQSRGRLAAVLPQDAPAVDVFVAHATPFFEEASDLAIEISERKDPFFSLLSADMERLNARYVALGHPHGRFWSGEVAGRTACVPGSPLPIRNERGRRHAAVVEMTEQGVDVSPEEVTALDYVERLVFYFHAGNEWEKQVELRRLLDEHADPRCRMQVEVEGCTALGEVDLNEILHQILNEYASKYSELHVLNHTQSWRHLMEQNPLVQQFAGRLRGRQAPDETRHLALKMGLEAFRAAGESR